MGPLVYVLIFIISYCLLYLWNNRRPWTNYQRLPPAGPRGVPFFGNVLQLDATGPHKTFTAWRKTYGDIFRIQLFRDNVVVLNDYDSILEMLVSKSLLFANRLYTYRANEVYSAGCSGISFMNYSEKWVFRKKTMITSLRAYGEGRQVLEDMSANFIGKMIERIKLKSSGSKAIDMKPVLHLCTAGIITSLFYGEEFGDAELLEMLETERLALDFLSPLGTVAMLDIFPALRFLPIPALREGAKGCHAFTQCLVRQHEAQKLKRQMEDRNCIGQEWDMLEKAGRLSKKEVLGVCIDMISASFVTTTMSTYALIGILVSKKQIQEKLYEEIQTVCPGRKSRLSDRKQMPYTEAVLLELMRYTTLVPLMLPHVSTQDTQLSRYHIPKGTVILANIWGLHHDERYWEKPFDFLPDRFLTEDGELVDVNHKNRKMFMAFGRGRRSCPGEQLARNRIFLILTHLVQTFQFKAGHPAGQLPHPAGQLPHPAGQLPHPAGQLPHIHPRDFQAGIVLTPAKFLVKVDERCEKN